MAGMPAHGMGAVLFGDLLQPLWVSVLSESPRPFLFMNSAHVPISSVFCASTNFLCFLYMYHSFVLVSVHVPKLSAPCTCTKMFGTCTSFFRY